MHGITSESIDENGRLEEQSDNFTTSTVAREQMVNGLSNV